MLVLMTNIVQFAYWNVQRMRKKNGDKPATHWYKYRPVYLLMVATILVNVQPMCMLIIGSWICDGAFTADQVDPTALAANNFPGNYYDKNGTFHAVNKANLTAITGGQPTKGTDFVDGCSPSMRNFFFDNAANPTAVVPNTVEGWMIQIFGTYLGFILMFIGVCQATMMHQKLAKKWNELRGSEMQV